MLKPCIRNALRETPDELLRAFLCGRYPAPVKMKRKAREAAPRGRFECGDASYRRY